MAVNEDLSAYSTTAASNTPAGSSNIGPDLDNHLRDIKRNIRRVAERYQGATTPEAFRGRDWVDTSGTASNKLELTMNDGTNEVPYIQIDTSAGTSTPIVHGTAIPTGSMAVQSASSVAITGGNIDATVIGNTSAAAGSFTTLDASGTVNQGAATTFGAGIRLQSGQDLLDQYDEGTFTPGVQDASANSATLSTADGYYTRAGNVVNFSLRVVVSSLGSMVTTDQARITGLPFTVGAGTHGCTVYYGSSLAIAAGAHISGLITSDIIILYEWDSAAGPSTLSVAEMSVGAELRISGHYTV